MGARCISQRPRVAAPGLSVSLWATVRLIRFQNSNKERCLLVRQQRSTSAKDPDMHMPVLTWRRRAMPPWRQYRDTQELEQKSRQSLRSVSMLALGQCCTLLIMPSGLHTPRNAQSPLHTCTARASSTPHLARPCIMGAVCCLARYAHAQELSGCLACRHAKSAPGKAGGT